MFNSFFRSYEWHYDPLLFLQNSLPDNSLHLSTSIVLHLPIHIQTKGILPSIIASELAHSLCSSANSLAGCEAWRLDLLPFFLLLLGGVEEWPFLSPTLHYLIHFSHVSLSLLRCIPGPLYGCTFLSEVCLSLSFSHCNPVPPPSLSPPLSLSLCKGLQVALAGWVSNQGKLGKSSLQ